MAGLGRRTFSAGEVLTAANVMGYLQDQAVMNFAGTASRGSAIPSPSEGMASYLADSNQVEVYDGSSWKRTIGMAQVAPTSVTPITSGTASFTASGEITYSGVAALRVNGVFTSQFRNYVIHWTNTFSSGNPDFILRWAQGSTVSSSGYFRAGFKVNQSGTTGSYNTGANVDGHLIGSGENGYNSGQINGVIDVFTPQTTDSTFSLARTFGVLTPTGFHHFHGGAAHQTTQQDGFYIVSSTGTFTGKISVYGYNN